MSIEEHNFAALIDTNFNAPEYVSSFLKQVKPGDELRHLQAFRKLLNSRSNAAAETIKDIVFEHYKHFIETSKEISNLEREIYQLSNLLSEQKGLIENLMEMSGQEKNSTSNASVYSVSSNNQNQLYSLMHKMDGVAVILNTSKDDERILLQSQLTLLNPETMEPEHSVLMVLLSSSLLIGYPTSGGGKYPFQLVDNYLLEEMAIVNVKSHGIESAAESPTKMEHVLKLIVFPEQKYVRCESARQKNDWLDTVEQVKRRHEQEKSLLRQATIRAKRRSISNNSVSKKTNVGQQQYENGRRKVSNKTDTVSKIDEEATSNDGEEVLNCADVQWLNDLCEELQVIISDRHMDQAVEMLLEWKSCACKDATINSKFATLERQVLKILSDEVRRPGALHSGGARGTFSRPLTLLTSLGRGIYAVDLYLRRRGASLYSSTSELVSEEPLSYVRQISTLFVNEVLDVVNEFAEHRQHFCLVLQWASSELSVLLSMIRQHVIEVAPTITVLAHTWQILTNNCYQLASVGMDLSFEINRLLTPALNNALNESFFNVIRSVLLRIEKEEWKPYNLENESNLNRFLEEMSDFGLAIDWAVRNKFEIQITQNACHFARLSFSSSRDFSLLDSARLDCLTDSLLKNLWCEYLFHLATAPPSDVQYSTIKFIVLQVIPLCDCTYQTPSAPDGRFAFNILKDKFETLAKFSRTVSFDEEIANV